MPQMAPIQWTMMYMYVLSIFLILNFFNYYMYMIYCKNLPIKNTYNKIFTWKW
uniref:ATP synthase F0 subunit 8 n=1 Tax=Omoglymmius wukong TaxID=2983420 RepID=A0A977TLH1_9CARA|nr:ATP synthase F0 subunit 8 [Omoglymmius wukong]UXW93689.1 ATP synthase F0 subunit 8 [Omoglymmius wukong]